jgi:hypothetical protein
MKTARNYVEKRRVSNRHEFKATDNREKDAALGTIGKGDSSKRCYSTDFKEEMNIPPHQNSSGGTSLQIRAMRTGSTISERSDGLN